MSEELAILEPIAPPVSPPTPKKKPAKKKKPVPKAAPKPQAKAPDTQPDEPKPLPKPAGKVPVMHDVDRARLMQMLRNRPISTKLERAYFAAQRKYHQTLQGPLPLDMLADLLMEAEKISVMLPDAPQIDEDASDRIANQNR